MSTWRLNYWILPELSTAGNLNTTLVDLFVVMTSSGSVFGVLFTFKFYQLTHAHFNCKCQLQRIETHLT